MEKIMRNQIWRKLAVIVASLCVYGGAQNAFAAPLTSDPATPDPVAGAPEVQEKNFKESWYLNLELYAGWSVYSTDLQAALDSVWASYPNTFHLPPIGVEIGFYFPLLDHKMLLGPVLYAISDTYTITSVTGSNGSLSLGQALLTASAQYYFGERIGQGFFVRGDFGAARFSVSAIGSGGFASAASPFGLGWLAGGGYSWPLNKGTRGMISLNYHGIAAGGSSANSMVAGMGVLF